jgi:hypothetical protein
VTVSQGYHSAPTKLGGGGIELGLATLRYCKSFGAKWVAICSPGPGWSAHTFFLMLSTALLRTPAFALQIHALSK